MIVLCLSGRHEGQPATHAQNIFFDFKAIFSYHSLSFSRTRYSGSDNHLACMSFVGRCIFPQWTRNQIQIFSTRKELAILWWAFFLFWCTLSVKHTNKKIQLLIQECIYLLPASIYLPPTRTQLKKSKHQQAQAGIQIHTTTYLNTYTQKYPRTHTCIHSISSTSKRLLSRYPTPFILLHTNLSNNRQQHECSISKDNSHEHVQNHLPTGTCTQTN